MSKNKKPTDGCESLDTLSAAQRKHADKMTRRKNGGPNWLIQRMDYGRTRNCWFLKIEYAGRPSVRKSFADAAFGGKRKALQAARKARGRFLALMKLPPSRVPYHRTEPRNKTGAIGIAYVYRKRRRAANGGWVWDHSYRVQWGSGANHHARQFSIRKYGKRKAFELAVQARKLGIAKLRANK
jgi:hypothetical protein